jgi:hypothetical protein
MCQVGRDDFYPPFPTSRCHFDESDSFRASHSQKNARIPVSRSAPSGLAITDRRDQADDMRRRISLPVARIKAGVDTLFVVGAGHFRRDVIQVHVSPALSSRAMA